MFSDEHALGSRELFWQVDRREEVSSELATHRLVGLLHWVESRPVRQVVRQLRWAAQRLDRGWDDRALWSLDVHLTSTLAVQLRHLAAISHGWPPSATHPTFDDWQRALEGASAALRRYADRERLPAATAYLELFDELDVDPDVVAVARQAAAAEDAVAVADAQTALRWVADHLEGLWD